MTEWRLVFLLCALMADVATAQEQPTDSIQGEAFLASQSMLASQGEKTLSAVALRVAENDPGTRDVLRRIQELDRIIAAAELNFAIAAGSDGLEPAAQRDSALNILRNAERERDALGISLRTKPPGYAALIADNYPSLREVQLGLSAKDMVVMIVVGPQSAHLWGITNDEVLWKRVEIKKEMLAADIETIIASVGGSTGVRGAVGAVPMRGAHSSGKAFPRQAARRLYRLLLEPLKQLMDESDHVYVVASDPVSRLPFSVMVTDEYEGSDDDLDALRATPWLIKTHAVTYSPSIGAISANAAPKLPPAIRENSKFFGIGAPCLPRWGGRDSCGRENLQNSLRAGGVNLGALPFAEQELASLSQLFGADAAVTYSGENAVRNVIEANSATMTNADVLAFATHAVSPAEFDGLNEPALVLSDKGDGEWLYRASDIAMLDLNASWAILSACNTAIGYDRTDGEILTGLAEAFLFAGVDALLVSYWPVDDEATAALTVETMRRWITGVEIGRAQALRQSMLALLMDKKRPWASHPQYWAPFQVVGGRED